MKRKYEVHQGGEVSVIEYDFEERRQYQRSQRDEERTRIAASIRHAIATLDRVRAGGHSFDGSVYKSVQLLRDALHSIVGSRQ